MKNAVILFSGGLDSTTCLAYAKSKDFNCHAISFNYGQKNVSELNAAKRIAKHYSTNHIIVDLPISQYKGSALTTEELAVPDYVGDGKIPITYVPARNTIFLSFALGWAEVLNAHDIFTGVSVVDYSSYPDCRPEYITAFQKLANLATKLGVEENDISIHTPLIYLSKAETIKLGLSLGVDYAMTVSCYQATPDGLACGTCDCCFLRMRGFSEAGITDQTQYVSDYVSDKVPA